MVSCEDSLPQNTMLRRIVSATDYDLRGLTLPGPKSQTTNLIASETDSNAFCRAFEILIELAVCNLAGSHSGHDLQISRVSLRSHVRVTVGIR